MNDVTANERLLRETEAYLHEQIPLTHAMGVTVESWNGARLVLQAPLEPNHNHLGTAFGGSLSALATLAGYSLLWLMLGDREAHVVVRDSHIRYRHPVRGTLRAACSRPDDAVMEVFRRQFNETGRARLSLPVTIEEDGKVCVEFEGTFVAMR
ncbi:MAG: YiiD C-terminal domain-containing protein [Prosthecobacter sp.]|jgi:thioesterase domain-containing protein|uniref:thioesterase domain-containing protein n=1 Tax=Prosthecobacter sp. TaxID=1965333 RepID=UPI0019E3FB6C|nr:thioesterase domain-containing protein [Prosthecobacter sp.]MBE2287767.1 YiiD C-terminal domain-containing protein [Prosthecobacter sp.]